MHDVFSSEKSLPTKEVSTEVHVLFEAFSDLSFLPHLHTTQHTDSRTNYFLRFNLHFTPFRPLPWLSEVCELCA